MTEHDDPPPDVMTIHGHVAAWAARNPNAVAIDADDSSVSYGQLHDAAASVAAGLQARGIGPESTVAVALPRSADLVVALLAVLRAGAAYVPLDLDYPQQRRDFMLANAGVAAIVTNADLAAQLDGRTPIPVLTLDALAVADHPPADEPSGASGTGREAAYVIYTSGSTGTPKGVVVEHRDVVALVRDDPRLAIAPGQRVAQLAPVSFDASTFEIWAALCRGATVVLFPATALRSVQELHRRLARHRPDWLFLTTGLFHLLADFAPQALAHVGTLLTGGDVLSPKHIHTAAVHAGTVYAAYGPTETTVFASLHRAGADEPAQRVAIGTPLTGATMYVLDATLQPVPAGTVGDLYVGGHGVARGYLHRPGLTAQVFLPDPFAGGPGARMYRTGDRASVRADGAIDFHGRTDRQVKVRGFRIELGEIEAVVASNPAVSGCVVVAVESDGNDKRLAAYVATGGTDSAGAVTASQLRAWAAQRLPAYALPATYVVLAELPLDPNGKFDRAALPQPWKSRGNLLDLPEFTAARNHVERTIAAAWTQALDLDVVGIHDNFFALGGDSLRSVSILEQLRAQGLDLSAGDFFSHPTVAELAEHLRQASPEPQPVPVGG
ncbi:non-ribosomal peptide synthetase [Dactylosporangium sp. NPDC000555]|uniref:non-ribosomal peptide synthetase n=1 Tax=Dactylosporangium sp. NPDC000555 TaxID=3154260 RepID=UPI00332F2922